MEPADDEAAPVQGPEPLDEDQLVAILIEEEGDATSFYSSELASAQAVSLEAYHGKLANDVHEPNRSTAVTHDVEDAINWLMPSLMRTFAPSDELVTCTDDLLDDDDPALGLAADYLQHVFFKDNPGSDIIHDFAFDGLVQKLGIIRTYWADPEPQPPITMTGLTIDQLAEYVDNPRYQVIEASEDGFIEVEQGQEEPSLDPVQGLLAPPQQMGPHGGLLPPGMGPPQPTPLQPQGPPQPAYEPTYRLVVAKIDRQGRQKVECVPPEHFRVSRRSKSLEDDYHALFYEEFLVHLIRDHPDKASELDPLGQFYAPEGTNLFDDSDPRIQARFDLEVDRFNTSNSQDGRQKVGVFVEYIRIDFDGDGIVELRRIKRTGKVILENDIVDESEFVVWSPIRVSHRLVGRSVADTLLDMQRIRSALVRRAMDSLARSLSPRTVINKNAVAHDPTLLDRFLDHSVGDVLDVDGNPAEVIHELVTPDVSGMAFSALQYMDQRAEEASGVNRHAMGIQPQAITDTKGGIDMLQSAGNARVEQVARWLAYGLEKVFGKILRSLIRHQDRERVLKLSGKRVSIDPRRWSEEMTVTVHIGMASENREKKMLTLSNILAIQERALTQLGPSNPIVTLKHVRNTLALITDTAGFKNSERFWGEIPEGWQPPEQGEDPKMAEAKAKMQMAQEESKAKLQLAGAEMQAKQQVEAQKLQAQAAMEAQKADAQRETDAIKAHSDAQAQASKMALEERTAEMRLQMEERLALVRMEMEERMAIQRMAMEREMATLKFQHERQVAQANFALKATEGQDATTDGDPAYRPGGRLDV